MPEQPHPRFTSLPFGLPELAYAEEVSWEAYGRQVRLAEKARQAGARPTPLDPLGVFGVWCEGPLLLVERYDPAKVYQDDALDPDRLGASDPHRFGHWVGRNTELTDGRCPLCEELLKAQRKKKLTKGQRAMLAADCWKPLGGPPQPGRPRKQKPGSGLASERPLFGYPINRRLMALRWGISEAMVKWATALVRQRDPALVKLANRVRRGTLGLQRAYEQLLVKQGGSDW